MSFVKDLSALRKAMALGRRNQIQEALRSLLDWLGAEEGGIYRWKDRKWEVVFSLGNLPCTFNLFVTDSDVSQGLSSEPACILHSTHRTQIGQKILWAARVPPESDRPAYLFVAAFSEESPEPFEIALQISAELIVSWVFGRESDQNWEYLARSFRVATLGELAAGIAHEINNPLQVIMGNAELILDTEELKERTKEKLTDILQAAEQIRKIAHSITHFADARRTEEKELLDFNKIVQEAAQLVAYSLVREGIKVDLELSLVPPIWGRRGDLEEIVVQLVRNAGEAISESGRGGKVVIRTGVREKWARLEVEDDGPGVPPNLRDRIFDPFVTTKAARGGTGLGLAIVQNLVTAHNGRIWLEDSPLGGAKFIVELPVWQIDAQSENREEGE